MKTFAVVFSLLAAVGAVAQEATPCTTTAQCPAGQECARADCPPCDPSADPTCDPTCEGTCVDVAPPPPTETPCTTDADCGPDQLCAVVDCARPCDVSDPACVPTDCPGGGVCIDRGPAPGCTVDDDCAGDDVCITQTVESCAGSGCACPSDGDEDPNNDPPCDCAADPASPPECTTESYAYCGPRYLADCALDADCGPGFTCQVHDACDCSSDPCDCPTEPGVAPPGTCELVRVECNDDCPEGLVCVDEATPCVGGAEGGSCDAPTEPTRICVPPGYVQEGPPPDVEGDGGEVLAGEDDRSVDDDAADATAAPGDDDDDVIIFGCAQGTPTGALPLAALALLLRRRRR